MSVTIRDAAPAEAPRLTGIATGAKAHWGYPPGWMEVWRDELTVTPERVAAGAVRVAVDDTGGVLGFAATAPLAAAAPRHELEHLWVDPDAMGRGVGRALLGDALRLARAAGAAGLSIVADPHAAPFYLRCGARQAAEIPGPMPGAPDRTLPRLHLDDEPR